MHPLSGTKQCDSIMLFFCLTKCVRFISSYKDSSDVVFYLKANKDSMKIICVLFITKLHFRNSDHFEKLQHFFNRFQFFRGVTLKQRIFILNDKQEQEINY